MQHFYQTINGFMNHRNLVMLNLVLDSFPPGGCWVELGSWTGKSAAYCVVELLNRNKLGEFWCVDSWQGGPELLDREIVKNNSLQQVFENNTKPIQSYIKMLPSLSWDAASNFQNESVDFCYVDAGHTYDCVVKDLNAWWPKIKSGCYFAGDDYTKGYPGLQKAVWEFFDDKKIRVRRAGRCWLVTKP